MFVEGDKTRDESVPYFEGIQVKKVVMNEKLPIKDVVLNTAVALSTIFAKNDLQPDYIQLEDDFTIDLIYGDITVKLGKDKYLEDKMSRMVAILPQITGEKGILHMENITESSKTVTFEKEEEEVTAENWTGGYDENGDYTGDGEYDENLNYVGSEPTQELLDSFGDWTGGYNESGGFDGVSEYDKDGNYVGPMPDNDGTSSGDTSEEDSEEDSSDTNTDSSDEDTESYSDEESDGWDQGDTDEESYE